MRKSSLMFLITLLVSSTVLSSFEPPLANIEAKSTSTDAWPMFRHDPGHTGFSSSSAPIDNETTTLIWSSATDGDITYSSPAVFGDWLFIGDQAGYLYAFNSTAGHRIWQSDPLGYIQSSPAVSNGIVFVGSQNGKIYALNMTTGEGLWNLTIGPQVWSSPTVVDGKVYIASLNRTVYAFHETNGTEIWKKSTPWPSNYKSSPAVADGKLFIGSLDGRVYAFNASNGNLEWNSTRLGGQIVESSPAVFNGKVFVGLVGKYMLYALSEHNGSVIWEGETLGSIHSSPAVAYGKVFVGSEDNRIYAFDENTGDQVWNFTTGGPVYSSPAVANGAVFVGSSDYKIYALNASTGKELWSRQTTGEIYSSPAVANGAVFVGSDSAVYAFGENALPIANFTFDPPEPAVNQTVTFNASGSYDSDSLDYIASYKWDFGDGNISTTNESIITHAYLLGGDYNVTLTVTDSHGAESSPVTLPLRVKKHKVTIVEVLPQNFTVTKGEVLNISVTVKNEGDYVENVTVTVWGSNTTDKIPVNDAQNISLLVNENKTLVFSWNTTNFARGTYNISATVDDQVKDDGDVRILVHDLALGDIAVNATDVLINQTVLINVTVINEGDFTENNVTVTVYANNNTLIDKNSTSRLLDGASWLSTFEWNTTGLALGNYTIWAMVTIFPHDVNPENNNLTYEREVRVRLPFHDVSVIEVLPSIAGPPYNITRGDLLNITVSVMNQGEYQSENVTVTAWYSNATTPKTIDTKNVTVEKDKIENVTLLWNTTGFSGGHYLIGAYANITDKDEYPNNNNKTDGEVFIIVPIRDIEVAKVRPLKPTAFLGRPMPIYIEFENIGNFTMPSFSAYAYANETQFASTTVPSLNPGERYSWEPVWEPFDIGIYTIKAEARITDEYSFNNNETAPIGVLNAVSDIAVDRVGTTPYVEKVARGRQVTITVEVENQGAWDETFTLSVYANQTPNGNITLINAQDISLNYLAPPLNVSLTWNTTTFMPANYSIFANVTILFGEEDVSDNHYVDGEVEILLGFHDVSVLGMPLPLPPKGVLCLSPWPEPELTANISVTIRNMGSFVENVNITIYLVDDLDRQSPPVGNLTDIILLPDETRSVIVPIRVWNNSGIEKDVYKIRARADILDDINPNNDESTSPLILHVSMVGDITGPTPGVPDGKVDLRDIAAIAILFGVNYPDPRYNANYDIIYDGKIDIKDIAICAKNYGKIDP